MWTRRSVSGAVVALLWATACASGEAADPAIENDMSGPAAASRRADEVVRRVALDLDVHASGFALRLGELRESKDSFGHRSVVLDATAVPAGGPDLVFDMPLSLDWTDHHISFEPLLEGDQTVPLLSADQPTSLTFVAALDDAPDLGAARLSIGAPGTNQAWVALDDSGTARSRTPVVVRPSTRVTIGALSLTLRSVEVRADDPVFHEPLTAGRLLVITTFDVRRGADGDGGIGAVNLSLHLPDGAAVGVRRDGASSPDLALAPGETATGIIARFEVAAPARGPFSLELSGAYGRGATPARGQLPFTLDADP